MSLAVWLYRITGLSYDAVIKYETPRVVFREPTFDEGRIRY